MSTGRGGEPRNSSRAAGEAGSVEPGSIEHRSVEHGPFDPALNHLIGALTTVGHPHEVGGRDAALSAFRAASQSRRSAQARRTRRREFPLLLMPARLAALVAAGAAVMAGLTVAAYAQALPAPVQEIAHQVLAPLGVPDSHAQPSGSAAPSRRTTSSARGVSPGGSAKGATRPGAGSGASPSATAGYAVTLKVVRAKLPTGAFAKFTGSVNHHGHPSAGEPVRLLERTQGTSGWQQAASGVTGRLGGVKFSVLVPTAAEVFRLDGPDGAHSASVTVTVEAPLTFWLVPGKTTDRLHVVAPFSKPGAAVDLMERIAGTWTRVAGRPLGTGHRVVFTVPASAKAGRLYRVVLPASALTSNSVWIPAHHNGAKAITTSPSPAGTASPSPTATPAPTASPGPTTSPGPGAEPSPPGASGPPTASSSPPLPTSPTGSGSPAAPSPATSGTPGSTTSSS